MPPRRNRRTLCLTIGQRPCSVQAVLKKNKRRGGIPHSAEILSGCETVGLIPLRDSCKTNQSLLTQTGSNARPHTTTGLTGLTLPQSVFRIPREE